MRNVLDFTPYRRSLIGFDRLFDMMDRASRFDFADGYPPYDVEQHGDDAYRIHLPKTTVIRQSAPVAEPANDGPCVLIVEDEPLIALALQGDLQEAGIAVGAIASGKAEAQSMIRARTFDLALVDLNLAGESTIDIARDLTRAGTKVIFCTGYQNAGLPADLSETPILVKPIDGERLKASLAQAGFPAMRGHSR